MSIKMQMQIREEVMLNIYNLVLEDAVISMTISSCNKYLVIADCLSNIIIWENKNSQWIRYCKLPKCSSIPTTVGIQPKRLLLVVAYADQKVNSSTKVS